MSDMRPTSTHVRDERLTRACSQILYLEAIIARLRQELAQARSQR